MAFIRLEVETPTVPQTLRVSMPGRERAVVVRLAELDEDGLDAVAEAWKGDLHAARLAQIAEDDRADAV